MDESGLNILTHRGIVHHVVRCLREGQMVVVLADQRGDDRARLGGFLRKKGPIQRCLCNVTWVRHMWPDYCPCTRTVGIAVFMAMKYPSRGQLDKENDLIVNSQRFHQVFRGVAAGTS